MSKFTRTTLIFFGALAVTAVLLTFGLRITRGADRSDDSESSRHDKFLLVWAGDQARTAPDFLATLNFDENSPDYGRLLNTAPLPAPGNTGNEPHHVGLSSDGRVMALGGLLSILKGQKEIFF